MTGISGLVAVYSARIYETVRRLVSLHIAHTCTCKMRTQTQLVLSLSCIVTLQPVCIHTLSCRVIGREVKVIEAVKLTCYVSLIKYLESH